MDKRNSYPFLPDRLFGVILERDGRRVIWWTWAGIVEPWAPMGNETPEPDDATRECIGEVEGFVKLGRAVGASPAQVVRMLESRGYRDIGTRQYRFRSGILFGRAQQLASTALQANETRNDILARNGGRHPPLESPEWPRWEQVTETAAACATGARVLGLAALESLANEVLKETYPQEYAALEERHPGGCCRPAPASFPAKWDRLCELAGLDPKAPWLKELKKSNRLRVGIVHHRPGYEDDFSDPDAIQFSEETDPLAVKTFLDVAREAFGEIFRAHGVAVPHI